MRSALALLGVPNPSRLTERIGGEVTVRITGLSVLAAFGILLPYAVAVGRTVLLGNKVGDLDYYRSGALARWDERTTRLTLAAFGLGLACCVPLIRLGLAGRSRRARLLLTLGLVLVAVAHLIAVIVVGFLFYYNAGGIL
jgi:hypothetical protein